MAALPLTVELVLDRRSATSAASDVQQTLTEAGRNITRDFNQSMSGLGKGFSSSGITREMRQVEAAIQQVTKREQELETMRKSGASASTIQIQSERIKQAKKGEAEAVREAATAYDTAGRSATVLHNALSGLANGAGLSAKGADGLATAITGIGGKTAFAAAGIAGLGLAAVVAGKQLYDLGAQWDSVADGITVRTGKVGAELTALTDAVGDIGSSTAAPLDVIGGVVGQLAQAMPGLAANNGALRQMGSNLSYLDANGQAVNIRELGMAFNVFGVNTASAVGSLDDLFRVSQATGIPINELIATVRQGAPEFKQFGLDLGQSTGLLASFSQAGLDPRSTVTGLRSALKSVADDARGAAPALADVITQIKAFHDAGQSGSAQTLAAATFGTDNFGPFLDAIESGTLNAENLKKALDSAGLSVAETQKATDDGAQGFQKLANTASRFGDTAVGKGLFNQINDSMNRWIFLLGGAKDSLEELASVPITADSALGKMLLPGGVVGAGPGVPAPDGIGSSLTPSPGSGLRLPGGLLAPQMGQYNVPGQPFSKGSAAKLPAAPVLPFDSTLPPGFANLPQTAALYSAESSFLDARHSAAEKQARLNQLEQDNNAKAEDVQNARNDAIQAKRNQDEAELRLYDAATKKLNAQTGQMAQIGAQLDNDFGVSKGLAGIADNITRFLANLALAPVLGALQAVKTSEGFDSTKQGSGLMGMLGSSGALGPRFMPGASGSTTASPYVMGPNGPQPGNAMPSILSDTGSVPSGPQSRQAAALIQQLWGDQIQGQIGGSRDNNTAKGTHDTGTSIDIPIGPNQGALGDQIRDYLQANAGPLGLEYTIWRDQGVYPGTGGKTGFTTPGHQNHIDAHFNGASGAQQGGATDFSSFGAPGSKQAIANMVYQQALSRGYSPHEAQSILAYAIGESGLNAGSSGGIQGGGGDPFADTVQGLFQQKPAFAQGGGISPGQRTDPVANTTAYLNQLEKNRNLPIEQALPATSSGGPLAKGGEQPWAPLMAQAQDYIGGGGGGGGAPGAAAGAGGPGWFPPGVGLPAAGPGGGGGGPGMRMPQGLGFPLGGPGGAPGDPGGQLSVSGQRMLDTETGLTKAPGDVGYSLGGPAGGGAGGGAGGLIGAIPSMAGGPSGPAGLNGVPSGAFGGPGVAPGGPLRNAGAAPSSSVAGGRSFGQGTPASGGVSFSGGIIGAAASMAGSAASMGMGGGAGSDLAIQLIGRAIGAGGQYAGNAVGGLMETFALNDSALADPGKSWLGKLAIAGAGARPALPNSAGALGGSQNAAMAEGGKKPAEPLTPEQAAAKQAEGGAAAGDPAQAKQGDTNITVNNSRATEDGTGKDIQAHLGASAGSKMTATR